MKHAFTLALLASAMGASAAHAASFDAGQAAYRQNQIGEARRQYAAVVADPAASATDRAGSARELGRLAWLVDRDGPEATRNLRAAVGVGAETCASAVVLVRVLRESGQAGAAGAGGEKLAPACDNPAEAVELGYQVVAADLDRAAAAPNERQAALAAAKRTLQGMG